MAQPSRAIASAFLIGATLCWAGNYVVGASAVREMSPFSLAYFRWAIAVVPLIVIAHVVERPRWRDVGRRQWAVLGMLAMLGLAGYTTLVYHALRHTSPLNAALINSFNPALIAVAAAVFLRERVGARGVAGLLLGLVGVILVLTEGHVLALFRIRYNAGDLIMLAAIACWTAYTILGRRLHGGIGSISSTAAQAGIAVLAMSPFALLGGHARLPETRHATISLLFIAIFPSVLAYAMWNSALRVIDAGRAGIYLNLLIVFTAIASLLLGDPITVPQIIGGAMVLAGVILTNRDAQITSSRRAGSAASRTTAAATDARTRRGTATR